jgi:hypothetical protein
MRVIILSAMALALTAVVAQAETFTSNYRPRVNERAEVIMTKCRERSGENPEPRRCFRFTYLEEVLAVSAETHRIRYTLQRLEPGEGAPQATPEQMEQIRVQFDPGPIELTTDAAGFPLRIENLSELLDAAERVLPADDPQARDRVRQIFASMTPEGAASLFARDFAWFGAFQGIEVEVGEPVAEQVETAFPLDPTITFQADVTLLIERIDRPAGVAHAAYTQRINDRSLDAALRQWMDKVRENRGQAPPADLSLVRDDDVRAEIDLETGRVVRMRAMSVAASTGDGRTTRQVDSIDFTRRLLAAAR